MESQEVKFDHFFKNRGGRFDVSSSEYLIYQVLLVYAREFLRTIYKDSPGLPSVYIDYIENETVNAYTGKCGDEYLIGINIGTIGLLYHIFYRMMSSNRILTDIGDISKEKDTSKIYDAQLTSLFQIVKKTGENFIPIDLDREVLVHFFMRELIEFIVLHEYGHIIMGHVDYYLATTGLSAMGEIPSKEMLDQKGDPIIYQTMEIMADDFAAGFCIEYMQKKHVHPGESNPMIRQFYGDWSTLIRMWVFPVYTFFRIFGRSNSLYSFKIDMHPAPSSRAEHTLTNMVVNFHERIELVEVEKLAEYCGEAMLEVEIAFHEISEQGLDLRPFEFALRPDVLEYTEILAKRKLQTARLMAPFAYGSFKYY